MDGIANVAKMQQSQVSLQESRGVESHARVEQPKQIDVVKEIQKESSNSSEKINSKEQVKDLVESLNKALAPMNTNIKFGVDQQDVFFVSVIESETSKIIRRFPAEQAADFLPKMQEVTGILFDSKG
ncbi:MAG: flagellar biosynthesis protein FlaG [Sulfurimonas sp. RIFOXYD12_FULL_33_39]|uniref:flagellar protein FlaG n=1 Tax=unclassified Sulfurimonas TaxID=2623549 RepID=UPI0008CAC075|nr:MULTISPECIES: flagellar protein FlaG [unclassified Sulfurimonas]OHE01950.1 MAG: flagellar biosynthesis protein FlaG [Sulfurimonas sp. RIFCSPLOWO2_12_FULL_34_6]OHE10101.1 MAG: flagellar biosynthesis protein FlaG [Sulfurimonas sp. RIFOXYD12_FULL_33_39]OHE14678.1 MAG: flagellar biosynthesis protein FlaG [Sulfurimonas sp. RIFOXYD2_FULL_34_21]DAB28391.1 MAG TPA: flagellar biosynthesis protein FlaG [Sulfurimonas sp. UBA10385]